MSQKKERPEWAKFNPYEIAIINLLKNHKGEPFTTNEIAKGSRMGWNTARKTLNRLFERGYMQKGKRTDGSVLHWRLITTKVLKSAEK